MIFRSRPVEHRTADRLRQHYEVERELSDRLRTATKEQRRSLYGEVYDELFRRVPDHPQLTLKATPELNQLGLMRQLRLLRPYLRPETTFLEIGPGDCALALAVAKEVKQVYALDVSKEITNQTGLPRNFELILSDGTSVPLPENSVDVAYSSQLMEHLHPDDALEQLQGIWRALRPGGVYVCVTPNRINGPHDISQHFDPVPTGFHLKEYTVTDLSQLFKQVGFRKVQTLVGAHGSFVAVPVTPVEYAETLMEHLPAPVTNMLGRSIARAFLGVRLVGTK